MTTKTFALVDCNNFYASCEMYKQEDPRCSEGQCLDELLLDALDRELQSIADSDRIIVLHQLGSHGPEYFRRSGIFDKAFNPECTDKQLQLCSRDNIVNAYDNSIVATDRLLANIINRLQQQKDYDASMLYMSDHGESLGENGVYLHGLPYFIAPDAQTHIPMIWWMSNEYAASSDLDAICIAKGQSSPLSHDNLFHSLLGIFSVDTALYESQFDIFKSCKKRVR